MDTGLSQLPEGDGQDTLMDAEEGRENWNDRTFTLLGAEGWHGYVRPLCSW